MKKTIEVFCEKLVFGGQGLGKYNGKKVFLWNALPGEKVVAEVVKKKRNYLEAVAVEISERSDKRLDPDEGHFLSCSPWQILGYNDELYWKKSIAEEIFKHNSIMGDEDNIEIYTDGRPFGYRNKMEYSFFHDGESLRFAFYNRGRHSKIPISLCKLADKKLNEAAAEVLCWLNKNRFPARFLKSLVLRSGIGGVLAALFVKDMVEFIRVPKFENLAGFKIYYSDYRSPASRPDKLLYFDGGEFICYNICGKKIFSSELNFFQVNIPLFERVINDAASFLNGADLVELYAGTGAISVALSGYVNSVVAVELDTNAEEPANRTIVFNGLNNYSYIIAPAEKSLEYIDGKSFLLLDPPRAGLHKDVVKRILEVKPPKIVYLSCNITTQARDIALLSESYGIVFKKLYNFFPRTPHFESLFILERL